MAEMLTGRFAELLWTQPLFHQHRWFFLIFSEAEKNSMKIGGKRSRGVGVEEVVSG
jgi:hypothetical protein